MTTQNATTGNARMTAAEVRYGTGAIALHWLLALALAFQIALGFAMPHHGPHSFAPMQLHKSVGIAILLLTLIRLGWRLAHRPPEAAETGWAAVAARIVHWAFYAVLVLGPITGWIIVSTARLHVPTMLFGILPWPHLPLPPMLNRPTEEIHAVLAWIAIGLFVLHVAGALRHQFHKQQVPAEPQLMRRGVRKGYVDQGFVDIGDIGLERPAQVEQPRAEIAPHPRRDLEFGRSRA